MDDPTELFDVVDERDQVVGRATRREVHESGLRHRSVHVLVFNSRGELFMQKRADHKDENPGRWDTSSAGHVNAGEDYGTCAHRELLEELGVSAELKPVFKIPACPETFQEHVWVYTCVTDEPITINPGEISQGRFWTLAEIHNAFRDGPGPFTSTFQLIFEKYLDHL